MCTTFIAHHTDNSSTFFARQFICFPKFAHVLFLHAGKVFVKFLVIILPVAVPKSEPRTKENDAMHSARDTRVHQRTHILDRASNMRQQWCNPYNGRDAL